MSCIEEERKQQEKAKLDLVQLIRRKDGELTMIAGWRTSGVIGLSSLIKRVFDDPMVQKKFQCDAWIKMMHHFDFKELLQLVANIENDGRDG